MPVSSPAQQSGADGCKIPSQVGKFITAGGDQLWMTWEKCVRKQLCTIERSRVQDDASKLACVGQPRPAGEFVATGGGFVATEGGFNATGGGFDATGGDSTYRVIPTAHMSAALTLKFPGEHISGARNA
eukprot:1756725-Pyramimonas_sp.AAC.1